MKKRKKRRRKKGKNKEINEKEYEETSILSDFSACMFEYEEIADHRRRNIIENPNMNAILCCRYMSYKFLNLAHRAANFPECTMLVDNTLDILGKQIEEKINACASTSSYPCTAPTNTSPLNDSLSTAHLKKRG